MNPNEPRSSRDRQSRDKFRNARRTDDFYHYATENRGPMVTYILLAVGIILLFVHTFIGGLLIGGVAGYYFAPEIISFFRNFTSFSEYPEEQVRYVIIAALLLAFLIKAPGIIIGALIGLIIRQASTGKGNKPSNFDRDFRGR